MPPEYFELTEINQSFSSVGAYRTGEANILATDRPRACFIPAQRATRVDPVVILRDE